MPLSAGQTFAGYTIVRLLGTGAMGEVYLAKHPRLPRREALKVLQPNISSDDNFRARFIREADAVAALDHPRIVTVYDRGESDGQLWIASQYIDGTDAAQLLRTRYPAGMPLEEAVPIVAAIAEALDYAHSQGFLHRDVKPANVLLTQPDPQGARRTYLADFGIARPLDDTVGLTATNIALGTVAYAAPEQLVGGQIDGSADQYALAATTYHLLTGVVPYGDSNPVAVIGNHLSGPIPRLSDRRPDLAALDPALSTAMAKDPRQRFNSCQDFAAALQSQITGTPFGGGPTQARLTVAAPKVSTKTPDEAEVRGSNKKRGLVLAGAAAAIVVTTLGVASVLKGPTQHPDRSATAPTLTPTITTTTPTTPPPSPAPTFESMRDFINYYYGHLPMGTREGWAELDASYQDKTGLQAYLDFWSTVQSVRVISIGPRDATSVVARLAYDWKDGHSTTEDRWLSMGVENSNILITDSGVASSNTTVTVTATPASPANPASRSSTAATAPVGNPLAAFCADNATELEHTFHEAGLDPAKWASDPRNLARFGFSDPGDTNTLYHMVIDGGAPNIRSYFSNESGLQWRCKGQ